jgi:hypothetical protein
MSRFERADLQTVKSLNPFINLDERLPVILGVLSPQQNAEQYRHPLEQRRKIDAAKVQKAGHCGTNLLDIVVQICDMGLNTLRISGEICHRGLAQGPHGINFGTRLQAAGNNDCHHGQHDIDYGNRESSTGIIKTWCETQIEGDIQHAHSQNGQKSGSDEEGGLSDGVTHLKAKQDQLCLQ